MRKHPCWPAAESTAMTSAGSFVHGGNGGAEGERRRSNEEQDINDFLSSIDQMTSAPAGTSVNLRGRSSPGTGDLFLGSPSPPAQQQAMGGSVDGDLVLGPDEGSAIADAFPDDWLNGMEGMGIGGVVDSSASQEEPPSSQSRVDLAQQEHQDTQQQQQQQQHRLAAEHGSENEEILGKEPEILDDLEEGYDSGAAAAGMLMSAGGRMASWAASTPASLVGAATAAFRGDAARTVGIRAEDAPAPAVPSSANSALADEPPLDWPGTLDMLGMADAETEVAGGSVAAAAAATAAVPVSELPSMAPPVARKESFPDFVEIRDPRNVSQFPKPDNAFVARTAAGGGSSSLGGDGEVGDDGGARAQGQEQRQVLPAPLRTVEVYLRPDVTWESVSDVYMAVMLSRGLVVRQQTEKMVRRERGGVGG